MNEIRDLFETMQTELDKWRRLYDELQRGKTDWPAIDLPTIVASQRETLNKNLTTIRQLKEQVAADQATILAHQKYGIEFREGAARQLEELHALHTSFAELWIERDKWRRDYELEHERLTATEKRFIVDLSAARCEGGRLAENAWQSQVSELKGEINDLQARVNRQHKLLETHIFEKQALQQQLDELASAEARRIVAVSVAEGWEKRFKVRDAEAKQLAERVVELEKLLASDLAVINYWKERAEHE